MMKNQKGFAPIILVIVIVIAIAGVAVVKKDLFIRSDNTSEVSDYNTDDQSPGIDASSKNHAKGGLADKPYEVKIEKEGDTLIGPQFSITPPAGWNLKPSGGNNKALFESPDKDEKKQGIAYFSLFPNINVHIAQALGKSVDDILQSSKNNFTASGIEDITTQKLKFAGEDAYYFEGVIKAGKLGAKRYEDELRSEIANTNKKVPEEDIQNGVQFIADNFNVKLFGYIIYKDDFKVTITGKSLTSFWDERYPLLKASIDTFKFLPK